MFDKGSVNEVLKNAYSLNGDTIELRRWFHQHPESSLKEYSTSKKIKEELKKLGIEYNSVGETGIVGVIKGGGNGFVIGLRADIDALEIQEQNQVNYKSLNEGLMHACGHDGHISSLITAARILQNEKEHLLGTVKLIFQSAEEIGYGADLIIKSGLVSDVKAFFGLHVTPRIKTGQVSLVSGIIMAGANNLKIELNGKSGHGAQPNQGIDAIFAGSAIIQSLQQIVSRECDPVEPIVITVGTFNAGTRANIIANKAFLNGTVRVVTEESRKNVSKAVKRVVKDIAAAFRIKAKVECEYATPIVINDTSLYHVAVSATKEILSEEAIVHLPVEMVTDDFAVFSTVAPAFYAKVGVAAAGSEKPAYPLHHENFNLDENSLAICSALFVEFTHQYFSSSIPGGTTI
ncbi:amidohydrolase [Clostridium algoriphilum]|uniref:amidohydrolase n=1 Tax=Clostridium algoriphilum TaxID=198347 RepID=UPI001CF40220|nr:amidohydrolase [Clostridium algoriphilum]MCB2294826.1 amidohydrolase [Clostridium algoriphilum]